MRTVKGSEGSREVVVVGGGVIGLSLARELARRGARVHLVEGGETGAEASRAAGGMLAPQSEADRNDQFFRMQCASRRMYPSFVEALREETRWDVELDRTGTLYLAFTEEEEEELERRYRWQSSAGLSVERLTGEEACALEPSVSPRVRMALRFPEDWQVENRRLLAALRESAESFYRVRIWTGARVEGLRVGASGRVEGVKTSKGFIGTDVVVLAAGAWTSQIDFIREGGSGIAPRHPRIVPVRGQMLCFAAPHGSGMALGHVVYTRRGYVVPRLDGRVLAGSTTEDAGFDKTVTAAGAHAILSNALEIAPSLGSLRLAEMWAGLRPRSDDGLPVVGESEEVGGLFYATGHYRNGILLAPLTAELVSRMVIDGADTLPASLPYQLETFSPARFRPAHAGSQQS